MGKRLILEGMKAIRPVKKQLLTDQMKKKRYKWAKKHKAGLQNIGKRHAYW